MFQRLLDLLIYHSTGNQDPRVPGQAGRQAGPRGGGACLIKAFLNEKKSAQKWSSGTFGAGGSFCLLLAMCPTPPLRGSDLGGLVCLPRQPPPPGGVHAQHHMHRCPTWQIRNTWGRDQHVFVRKTVLWGGRGHCNKERHGSSKMARPLTLKHNGRHGFRMHQRAGGFRPDVARKGRAAGAHAGAAIHRVREGIHNDY